jgi:drug/metabolite transporter (DMT)-like permease
MRGDKEMWMLLGVTCAVLAGLMWAANGTILSRIARRGQDPVSFLAIAGIGNAVAAWAFVPDYGALRAGQVTRLLELAILMMVAGASVGVGALSMQGAFRRGHHGATWSINQAALVSPFLIGLIVWGDTLTLMGVLGAASIVACLTCLGIAKGEGEHLDHKSHRTWLGFALLAFALTSIELVLKAIPNQWTGWEDVARIRAPLSLTGGMIIFQLIALAGKRYARKLPWIEIVVSVALIVPSQVLIFKTLDIFKTYDLTGLAWPVAIATCIVAFALYSVFVLKERMTLLRGLGIALGVVGIVLIFAAMELGT